VTLKGYLLPEGNFDHRSTTQKYLSPKRVVFSENVDTTVEKNIGLAGQFRDELDSKNVSLPSAEGSDNLGITLINAVLNWHFFSNQADLIALQT